MPKKLKVLDLFSGIGGFSLGLERTGGFETVAFCEIEPFPRKVLVKHWPKVPCYDDVRTLTADTLRRDGIAVDVICGGFPCQDLSVIGKQKGMDGTRSGLWSEIIRLASELRPGFIIVENVTALLSGPTNKSGGWFSRVLGDLAALGYDAEWECLPASSVGAYHSRDRVWLVAYPIKIRQMCEATKQELGWYRPTVRCLASQRWSDEPKEISREIESCVGGVVDGVPDRSHRIAALGNAVVPQIPELIGNAILASLTPANQEGRK